MRFHWHSKLEACSLHECYQKPVVLVTGSSGLIGAALCKALARDYEEPEKFQYELTEIAQQFERPRS